MTRRSQPPFLLGLLSALYFSGAQVSALIVPAPNWTMLTRLEAFRYHHRHR